MENFSHDYMAAIYRTNHGSEIAFAPFESLKSLLLNDGGSRGSWCSVSVFHW